MKPTKLKLQLFVLGVSQTEIAQRANVSVSYINRVINGEQKPSRRIETVISEILGLPIDALFENKSRAKD